MQYCNNFNTPEERLHCRHSHYEAGHLKIIGRLNYRFVKLLNFLIREEYRIIFFYPILEF